MPHKEALNHLNSSKQLNESDDIYIEYMKAIEALDIESKKNGKAIKDAYVAGCLSCAENLHSEDFDYFKMANDYYERNK